LANCYLFSFSKTDIHDIAITGIYAKVTQFYSLMQAPFGAAFDAFRFAASYVMAVSAPKFFIISMKQGR
jgi:hypothetical protein